MLRTSVATRNEATSWYNVVVLVIVTRVISVLPARRFAPRSAPRSGLTCILEPRNFVLGVEQLSDVRGRRPRPLPRARDEVSVELDPESGRGLRPLVLREGQVRVFQGRLELVVLRIVLIEVIVVSISVIFVLRRA